jgi:endonuclease/exonuclease/phosphatase family metal-dependent hydrolase
LDVRFWVFAILTVCSAAAQSITVASLNLAMVTDADAIVKEIRSKPALAEADILLFQEVVVKDGAAVAERVAKMLGREMISASPDGRNSHGALAILSRLPMENPATHKLKPQNLIFRSRSRIALAVTVNTPFGRIRVINAHLDTRINPGERVAQLQAALDDASCFNGPSIIGGDFNTNDMQWVSNVVPVPWPGWQAERVRVLMEQRGYTTPFQVRRATFDHLGMQLDWIYSAGLNALASGIEPLAFSDHHAVWAKLSLVQSSSPETTRSRAARQGGA